MSRYVVTELEGFASPASVARTPGRSCQVVDTLWNRRVVACYQSEDFRGRAWDAADARAWASRKAAADCEARNAAYEREAASSTVGTAA